MRFNLFIAGRYLFSKKNTNAVNIISGISMLVFFLGAAVTIIFLGFLNGLEGLVEGMNTAFDPDAKINPIHSKVFEPEVKQKLLSIDGVKDVTEVLEENVVVKYGDAQELARMKGIDSNSVLLTRIDTLVLYGKPIVRKNGKSYALFGNEIGVKLNINTENYIRTADVIIPRRGQKFNQLNPEQSISQGSILPGAVVMISKDIEKDYVIVPIDFAREILDYQKEVSSLEVFFENQVNSAKLINQIRDIVGAEFTVKNSAQLNEAAYKVFKTEKWVTFLLLMFVMIIAAFNAVGALTMLVMEKKKDVAILKSMGASSTHIRRIFIRVGMLICLIGSSIGLSIGVLFSLGQAKYGWLKMENGIIEAWPIDVHFSDVLIVLIAVNFVGYLISLYPAKKAANLSASQIENK